MLFYGTCYGHLFSKSGHAWLLQAADALSAMAKCAGKAYFITNDDPQPFWGFLGDLLEPLGYDRPSKHLPWQLIFFIAVIVEFIIWLLKPIKVFSLSEPNSCASSNVSCFGGINSPCITRPRTFFCRGTFCQQSEVCAFASIGCHRAVHDSRKRSLYWPSTH